MILDLKESEILLEKYKISHAKGHLCRDLKRLKEKSRKLKFPQVLKIMSPEATHKTDRGLVKTGMHSEAELVQAFYELEEKGRDFEKKEYLLQEQVNGVEFIIGGKKDASFGKIIVFGLGGVFVELMKQRAIRILPITKSEIRKMCTETKADAFFRGYRGKKANEERLIDAIERTAKLIMNENISELDFNPIIANEKEAVVVDARIIIE